MNKTNQGIVLSNVTKRYGNFVALNNISTEINKGLFGLLGRNGAGKTTLMQLLTTLIEPTEGTIVINGVDALKDKMTIKQIVGYLPQEFNIYPQLTSIEFLDYIAQLNKIGNFKKRKEVVYDVLEKVNLLDHIDKKIAGYSGGMKRRLGIAQALVKDPQILIVDEPTAGLDPEERIRFRTMLVELSEKKIVILSTHIVEDISSSCEKIALLDKGEIKYSGNPQKFVEQAYGSVWEINVKDRKEILYLKNKYPIISIKQTNNNVKIRVISEELNDTYDAEKVEPNLEDAYIYYFECLTRGVEHE